MNRESSSGIGKIVDGNYVVSVEEIVDEIVDEISSMGKEEVTRRIMGFKGFKLDYTEECLDGKSVEKLRHIYFAAMTATIKR